MPLGAGYFGTNIDGSESHEYCKFCYQRGFFAEQLSMEQMIEKSINHMVKELHFERAKAEKLARETIPKLKGTRCTPCNPIERIN